MTKENYTYKDWWNGTVYLESCPIKYQMGADLGIKVGYKQFQKAEAQKIRKKQKELFDKQRDKMLKALIAAFKSQLKKSDAKTVFLQCEFADVNNVISDKLDLSQKFHNWNATISREDLFKMRSYVKEQIIKGEKNYDFIHSPKYPYQANDKIPAEVYARACWDYFQWLNVFVDALNKRHLKPEVDQGSNKTEKKLSVPVIALAHFYKKTPITRDNCKNIAAQYGYNSMNSGEGLYQDYTKYLKNSIRTGLDDESPRKNQTKKKYLNQVIALLKGRAKNDAIGDLGILEKRLQKNSVF